MKLRHPNSQERISRFVDEAREKGLSVTPQRVAVFKKLISTDSHPTAEEIYEDLRKELPAISLATVYKTLETFEKEGFISKTRATGERARFDANQHPHHHLICKECGRIEDLYDARLEQIALPKRVRFKIEDYRIDFRGVCEECKTKTKQKK
jgi:Fur family peroxide stress response transcriptional regulator